MKRSEHGVTHGDPPDSTRHRLLIRPALGESDLHLAAGILEQVTVWLAARGLRQWPVGSFESEDGWGRSRLRDALSQGELYLAWDGDRAVATITLQRSDPLFWADGADALYIHRLAVDRSAAGQGVGSHLIDWAAFKCREQGRRYLRLNTLTGSDFLRGYYRAAGFEQRGHREVHGRSFVLLEKQVIEPPALRG
jgi:GNAT superfamily N-acetyltransferase